MTAADADTYPRRAGTRTASKRREAQERLSVIAPLFVASLAIPLIFFVGPLRLSPYRILLILAFIPAFMAWVGGRAGPVRTADVLILLAALWAFLSLLVHHGFATALESGGMYFLETVGAYLLARVYVRNLRTLLAVARVQFALATILLPLAIIEAVTGNKTVLAAFSKIGPALDPVYPPARWGLTRAQTAFEHPILFGVFVSSALGLSLLASGYGRSFATKLYRSGVIMVTTLFSLSSGPLTALAAQFFFLAWDRGTRSIKRRWTLLCGLIALAYLAVDMLSNRTPIHVFISYLTFSQDTGYGRILVFEYGMQNIAERPIFGTGLGDWDRPWWMSGSMDNFWLVFAVKYGVPMFLIVFSALLLIVRRLSLVELGDPALAAARAGILITIGGLAVVGATVHFWNATYVWFMFLLGSGMWLLDADRADRTRKAYRRRSVTS